LLVLRRDESLLILATTRPQPHLGCQHGRGVSGFLQTQFKGWILAQVQGRNLNLNVGYSHPSRFLHQNQLAVEGNTNVIVSGFDKELVGNIAALIRDVRPPEPYKGKGIRYAGEVVRRKAGKAGKK